MDFIQYRYRYRSRLNDQANSLFPDDDGDDHEVNQGMLIVTYCHIHDAELFKALNMFQAHEFQSL